MNPELLQNPENFNRPSEETSSFLPLNKEQIGKITFARKQLLELVKTGISRKLYYNIEEKLAQEERQLREILDWQEGRQSRLARYSFILDPHYFEQEFLT